MRAVEHVTVHVLCAQSTMLSTLSGIWYLMLGRGTKSPCACAVVKGRGAILRPLFLLTVGKKNGFSTPMCFRIQKAKQNGSRHNFVVC